MDSNTVTESDLQDHSCTGWMIECERCWTTLNQNTGNNLPMKQMFDISEKSIVGQSQEIHGVNPTNWEHSSWKQLSSVIDEEVISLSHAKGYVWFGQFFHFGQFRFRPISTSANHLVNETINQLMSEIIISVGRLKGGAPGCGPEGWGPKGGVLDLEKWGPEEWGPEEWCPEW